MSTQYVIALRRFGQSKPAWQTSNFLSLKYTLNLDDVTEVEFEPLPDADIPLDAVNKLAYLQIWRKPAGTSTFVLEGGTEWIVTKETIEYGPSGKRKITASHPNFLLSKRLVAYTSDTPQADKTADNGTLAPIVTLMEQFFNENMTVTATDAARATSIALVSVPAVAPPVEITAPWRQLLTTMQDLARELDENGERCYFSMESLPAGISFRIARGALGADLSQSIIFDLGNLIELTEVRDFGREVNAVYVGGEGSGADQIVALVTKPVPDPIYRWEDFLQAGFQVVSDGALEAEGSRYLGTMTAKRTLRARITNGAPYVYGTDFKFGDAVGLRLSGSIYKCVIFAVEADIADGREDISIYLDAEATL